MEKFICTKTGKEVKMGDTLQIESKVKTPFGTADTIQFILITEDSLKILIEMGIIKKEVINKEESERINVEKVPMNLEYYVQKLADRMNWHFNKMNNYLLNIHHIYPAAVLSILLREIAIELDKNYPDHINNCEEFFSISLLNGKITKQSKAHVKNFRNFAAFRTLEDARIACRIIKPVLKLLFSEERK